MFSLSKSEIERANSIHRRSVIFEMFGDPPIMFTLNMLSHLHKMIESEIDPRIMLEEVWGSASKLASIQLEADTNLQVKYLQTLRAGGVTAVSVNCGTSSDVVSPDHVETLGGVSRWLRLFDKTRGIFVKVTSDEDVLRAKSERKIGIVMTLHNGAQFGDRLENVEFYYNLGIRQVQITMNHRNLIGDGYLEVYQSGLSKFGHEVVSKLNQLGVVIDVSHASHLTMLDIIQNSKDPVTATHVNCYTVANNDYNLKDNEIIAIADRGGMIGVTMITSVLTTKGGGGIDNFLDHVDYAIKLVGVDHVGIGLDDPGKKDTPAEYWREYNKILPRAGLSKEKDHVDFEMSPVGYERYQDWPIITQGLVSRGYSDNDIEKILGANYLKLFKRITK